MKRLIIRIDEDKCTGCGLCLPSCAEGALVMVNGRPTLLEDKYCDGLGACLAACPVDALHLEEREAVAFDEAAAHQRMEELKAQPSACAAANASRIQDGPGLKQWPVQLRLIQPGAPFLKGAELLLTADCAPVALTNFHSQYLPGKAVLVACPKFDDIQASVQRLAEILAQCEPAGLTILRMEVPCCGGLSRLAGAALKLSGRDIPVREIVVSSAGQPVKRDPLGAL